MESNEDDLVDLCQRMSLEDLSNLTLTQERQHNICQQILFQRTLENNIKIEAILNGLNYLGSGQVLDVSQIDNQGRGIRIIDRPSDNSGLVEIHGYDVYVTPSRRREIMDLLYQDFLFE